MPSGRRQETVSRAQEEELAFVKLPPSHPKEGHAYQGSWVGGGARGSDSGKLKEFLCNIFYFPREI